jgi:nucleoside-diphosphate-sugar epimerase
VPGDGRAVVQFVSTVQVGEAVANAVERSRPGQHAWNIANAGFTSLDGFVELCAGVAGVPARTRRVPAPPGPFNAYDTVFPFPNEDYVLDTARSEAEGSAPTPTTIPAMLEEAHTHLTNHPDRRTWVRTSAEQALLERA